jgi:iron complex outermembrane recepter protein
LVTNVNYSTTSDYFSQVFLSDSIGTVIYTEGNLGRLQNYGLSVALQLAATPWWSLSAQGVLNYKKMEGVIWKEFRASINQLNINLNNQFHFKKEWSAEISGFYTSRSQSDIQEILDPAGQLSAGISKTIMKNKATIKLAVRDVFYTNWMKGLSQFQGSTEYFKLTRDTRVLNLSLTWRFGKAFKTSKRLEGAASEEIQRVGNG